jgi:hypothetical protein
MDFTPRLPSWGRLQKIVKRFTVFVLLHFPARTGSSAAGKGFDQKSERHENHVEEYFDRDGDFTGRGSGIRAK